MYPAMVLSLAFAAAASLAFIVNRNPREWFVLGVGVIELVLLAYTGVAVFLMITGDGPADLALYISYVLFTLLLLPAALLWALVEKSRWGTAVLVFAALVVAALMLRMQQIWEGAPGVA